MIFCASTKQVASVEKHYKPMKGDERHCLFNYKDAINWIEVSKLLEKSPTVVIIDLETGKGNLLFSKIKSEFPNTAVIGIEPSKKKEP